MRVTIINGDPRTVLVTGGIVMEPDDNFSLINSYNIEECQPRQLPQAFTCNKVTPMPLVPDVSLVFDSKPKESRHIPYDQLDNSPTLQENGGTSKPEDQGPRKVKPSPIAPLPNETYAAWRARACNAPTLSKSILPVATLKSGAKYGFGSSKNDDSAAFERVGEPSTTVPYGISCHEDFTPKTDESNYVCLMEKTLDHYARGRALSGLKVSHQNGEISESLRIQNKITPSRSLTSRPGTSRERACSQNFHVSSPVNYKNLHSFGNSSENQSIPVHPRFIENECVSDEASVVGKVKQAASSHYMVQDHASREVVGDFDRINSWDESSVPGKVSAKKRDTMRDLYRIVQLQNEQLKSLQAQVEKLLKRNITEQPLSFLLTKPKGCGSVICIEEGTQTVSEPDGMLSVGVMTSFMDLNMCSSDPGGDSIPDNGSHCTCIGCPGRTPLIGEAANDTGSEECNSQEINCNTNLMHTSSNSVGRKYEAPRSLVRNLRNMHQVIEEETESDESTKRCDEIASQIKHNHHNGKPNIHQECDGRVLNLSRNKPARVYNNGGKSKSKTTSSDVGKVKSKSSNPETAFSEKTQEKCEQNYRPQEKPKHCLGHTSVAHKTVTAKSQHNDDEMTMTLNGVDLQTVTEPQLSPEPSIHVDIQDYKDFSGEMEIPSDQDSDYSGNEDSCSESGEEEDLASLECRQNPCNSKGNKAEKEEGNGGKVGWTFYNNVLGQVNKLLENQKRTHLPQGFSEGGLHDMNLRTNRPEPSSNPGPASRSPPRGPQFPYQDINIHKALTSPTMEVVREATLQHLRQLGINLPNEQLRNNFSSPVSSNSVANPGIRDLQDGRRVTFDPRTNRGGIVGERRPTETSLRIKALALKYLSDEQLASCGFMGHKDSSNPESAEILGQPSNLARGMIGEMSSSADFTLYGMNGTNLSFTTLRYLQRYHLLPSNGAGPAGIWRHQEGIQETNFMESGLSKGPDLGDTKSPGHIDYTNDYMEGLRQGANMAMGLAGKAHSSTPATKVDHALPSAKMTDSKKEVYVLQNGRDFENGSRDVNGMGNQVVQSEKKITTKPRSKGKRHGFQAQRDKECERNAISNGIPEKAARERPLGGNVLRANDQKQRVHNESLRSSNILDITALRQQPKLL